jgi:hypothetical protein
MTPDHGFDFHASLNVSENPAYGAGDRAQACCRFIHCNFIFCWT